MSDSNLPIAEASLYVLKPHPFPEVFITIPCDDGPLLIGCDALMHVRKPSTVLTRFMLYLMSLPSPVSIDNVPKPAPLWFKRTVWPLEKTEFVNGIKIFVNSSGTRL